MDHIFCFKNTFWSGGDDGDGDDGGDEGDYGDVDGKVDFIQNSQECDNLELSLRLSDVKWKCAIIRQPVWILTMIKWMNDDDENNATADVNHGPNHSYSKIPLEWALCQVQK